MQNYIDLIKDILENGVDKPDRTGVGSRSVMGRTLRWDLSQGFPLVSVRPVPMRAVFEENMFFLRGQTDTNILAKKGIGIWKGNTSREFLDKTGLPHLPEGNMGYGYSHQWRNFNGFSKIIPENIDTILKDAKNPPASPHMNIWATWSTMILACYDPTNHLYDEFGAKNIFVSTRWLEFENFLEDLLIYQEWPQIQLRRYKADKAYFDNSTVTYSQPSFNEYLISQDASIPVGIDQIRGLVDGIQANPYSRRHIISGWNPSQLDEMALPPCHLMNMYSVTDGKLNSCFVMRSNDVPYGLPFNIAGYALLNYIFAKLLGYQPGELVYMGWDIHIYQNQMKLAEEIIHREPRPLPQLEITKDLKSLDDLFALEYTDLKLTGYNPYPDVKDKPRMAT